MNEKEEFAEQFDRLVQEVPLEELRTYRATAPNGSVLFIPRVKRYGAEVVWEGRVQITGACGPVRITEESLRAIQAPPEWLERGKEFQNYLQNKFPVLEIPVGAAPKELEAGVEAPEAPEELEEDVEN